MNRANKKRLKLLSLIISLFLCTNIFGQKYNITNSSDETVWVKVYAGIGEAWMAVTPTIISGGLAGISMSDCLSNITKEIKPRQKLKIDVPCCMSDIKVSRTDNFDSPLAERTGNVCSSSDVFIHKSAKDTFYIDTSSDLSEYEKKQIIFIAASADAAAMEEQANSGEIVIKYIPNKPADKLPAGLIGVLKADEEKFKKADPKGYGQFHNTIIQNKNFKNISGDILEGTENLVTSGLLESRSKSGETPLMLAAKEGSRDWVAFILRHQANPELKNNSNQTALHLGASSNDLYIIQAIIKAAQLKGLTPAQLEVFINQKDNYGNTAFDLISDSATLEKLLSNPKRTGGIIPKFSDVNKVNPQGNTKLMSAIKSKRYDLAVKLLNLGANPNINDSSKNSALFYLITNYDKSVPLSLRNLILQTSNVNNEDVEGLSPLTRAIFTKDKDLIHALLASRADLNKQNLNSTFKVISKSGPIEIRGLTPLLAAIISGEADLVEILVKKGAKSDLIFKVFENNKMNDKSLKELIDIINFKTDNVKKDIKNLLNIKN